MRRFAMLAVSASLTLAFSSVQLVAQDAKESKDAPAPKTEVKTEAPAPKTEAKEAPKPTAADAPIPKEVQDKLEAARKAVAEAIVAAQDAGLVDTTIEPPPILDILVTGRATDAITLKNKEGASPEVFGAWFTNQGKTDVKLDPMKDVRITQPSKGLKSLYDQRASVLNKYLADARKAKAEGGAAATAKAEDAKKAEMDAKAKADSDAKAKAEADAKKADEEKAKTEAEAKKKAEMETKAKADADAKKKAEDEAKAKAEADAKKAAEEKAKAEADAKKAAEEKAKADADAKKAAEDKAKAEEPKKEEPKAEEPKKEEPKAEEKKADDAPKA